MTGLDLALLFMLIAAAVSTMCRAGLLMPSDATAR